MTRNVVWDSSFRCSPLPMTPVSFVSGREEVELSMKEWYTYYHSWAAP